MADLDMLAFRALVESSARVNAAKTIEEAWVAMSAAQATGQDMKKLLKPYDKQTRLGRSKKSDQDAFIAAFRRGQKK